MPPSAFLLQKEKKQRHWEVWDYGLAEAAQRLSNERCKKCGVEAWHAYSENAEIAYAIDTHECHSCAYLESHEDKKSDKDKKDFGVTEMVKAVHVDTELAEPILDSPLPTRQDWIDDLIKKQV